MFGPRRAVFLDRDGVLVVPQFREGRSFAPTTLAEFAIYPDAPSCVGRLKEAGFFTVIVTNQPDVGAGRITREIVDEMSLRLRRAMPLDAIKICCHTSQCACRKPQPGMLLEAARELKLDLKESFMVGDRASDIEAGAAAGCRTVFIDLGYTAEQPPERPDRIVGSFCEAADWILSLPQEDN